MDHSKRGDTAPGGPDLVSLLDTEARLDGELMRVRSEAAGLIAAARTAAEQRERALAADLQLAVQEMDARLDQERDRAARVIAETTRQHVERYQGIPEERVTAVAARIVASLIEEGT